ncbi:hypothetical protein OH77DRAFT_493555 [Trametes cingulata]|nr:hypothetical protein OH77DRAFT_493555 [Trametes cingulata]
MSEASIHATFSRTFAHTAAVPVLTTDLRVRRSATQLGSGAKQQIANGETGITRRKWRDWYHSPRSESAVNACCKSWQGSTWAGGARREDICGTYHFHMRRIAAAQYKKLTGLYKASQAMSRYLRVRYGQRTADHREGRRKWPAPVYMARGAVRKAELAGHSGWHGEMNAGTYRSVFAPMFRMRGLTIFARKVRSRVASRLCGAPLAGAGGRVALWRRIARSSSWRDGRRGA